jgi:hypothetical protein
VLKKNIVPIVISSMECEVVLLCKLEKIFPPYFFNHMQHFILHLPYEVKMGGLCSFDGWMYAIEREKKILESNAKINPIFSQP